MAGTKLTVRSTVNAPLDKSWEVYTNPELVQKWNCASPDWHCPKAENDLRDGGKFSYRMEAKDGSMGFDFYGVYDEVKPKESIRYTIGDGRKAEVLFKPLDEKTDVIVNFEAEDQNSLELQQNGWQAILDNYKKAAES